MVILIVSFKRDVVLIDFLVSASNITALDYAAS
jgi:hypothetical protein